MTEHNDEDVAQYGLNDKTNIQLKDNFIRRESVNDITNQYLNEFYVISK